MTKVNYNKYQEDEYNKELAQKKYEESERIRAEKYLKMLEEQESSESLLDMDGTTDELIAVKMLLKKYSLIKNIEEIDMIVNKYINQSMYDFVVYPSRFGQKVGINDIKDGEYIVGTSTGTYMYKNTKDEDVVIYEEGISKKAKESIDFHILISKFSDKCKNKYHRKGVQKVYDELIEASIYGNISGYQSIYLNIVDMYGKGYKDTPETKVIKEKIKELELKNTIK